nr:transient receptor potential cation channel trpm-like [Cherax quadricarinatus]
MAVQYHYASTKLWTSLAGTRWVETVFNKRECVKFIPSSKDNARCCCGQLWQCHRDGSPATLRHGEDIHWSPSRHTQLLPTDAYGTLEFQGGAHPTKAQYVRLAHDTRPEHILQLLTGEWGLELPKLLITVQGGKTNFDLQPKLKKVIRKGLLKAAKTTGAWVFTAGTNTGVTRQVGEALVSESSLRVRSGRVVSVGIAPWGVIERRQELIGRNKDVPYHPINSPKSKFVALNSHHTFFLLVDNGTVGKYGPELILRRKLENYISKQRIEARGGLATPVVCVVIEGGPQTIRQVLEYVTDSPPVPVIVCDGTGRAADILAFVHKYASSGLNMIEANRDTIILALERVFELRTLLAEKLFAEILQCVRKRDLITVFRLKEGSELDQSILSALLHAQRLNPPEQLSLALTWNRVDIARSHVFIEDVEWSQGALEQAMMDALVNDRIEFVKLLLEQGVTMNKFLSIQRLEELYNSKCGPSNTLRYIIRDVKKNIPRDYRYTLIDIGLVVNKLMGGAYRSYYTRKKFRTVYENTMMKSPRLLRNNSSIFQASKSLLQKNPTNSPKSYLSPGELHSKFEFDYPFSELLVWAVLTKRQGMAMLMWQHGEEAIAKALVAAKLFKALAHEAADDDLETEVYEELKGYAKEFETLALQVLDFCYQQDDDRTHQLLTYELRNWSKQTCLSLAVAVNHRALLSHTCCQILLADLWLGGLRTRKNTNIKVMLSLLFPPLIPVLGFRSREELKTMPQTREEHQDDDPVRSSDSESDTESEEDNLDMRHDHDPEAQLVNTVSHPSHPVTPTLQPQAPLCNSNTAAAHSSTLLVPPPQPETVDTVDGHGTPVRQNGVSMSHLSHLDSNIFNDLHSKQLPARTKFYEFYNAPISKFWAHSMAYVFFLCLFTYTVLVKLPKKPEWMEWYVVAYISTLILEKVREILSTEPVELVQKIAVWSDKLWNVCDMVFAVFFMIGLTLRLQEQTAPEVLPYTAGGLLNLKQNHWKFHQRLESEVVHMVANMDGEKPLMSAIPQMLAEHQRSPLNVYIFRKEDRRALGLPDEKKNRQKKTDIQTQRLKEKTRDNRLREKQKIQEKLIFMVKIQENLILMAETQGRFILMTRDPIKMHRDSENLAVSLEDLCSVRTDLSDTDDGMTTFNVRRDSRAAELRKRHSTTSIDNNPSELLSVPGSKHLPSLQTINQSLHHSSSLCGRGTRLISSQPGSPSARRSSLREDIHIQWASSGALPASGGWLTSRSSPRPCSPPYVRPQTPAVGETSSDSASNSKDLQPCMATLQVPVVSESEGRPKDTITETEC